MTAMTGMVDSATAIRRVNDTLHGPVVDILAQFLPELKGIPREAAYAKALDDLDLLDRCFKVFRAEREMFRFVVVDARHRPVAEESVMLACGRTLADVIAMVVRTAAKRYFRRKLSPAGLLGRRAKAATQQPTQRTAADELYDAIKDYLLHEWQVPLVPSYAHMSPAMVRDLGERLLDYREPDALRRLIAGLPAADTTPAPAHAPTTQAPERLDEEAPAPAAKPGRGVALGEILSPDGRRLKAEAFTTTLLQPDLRAAVAYADQMVRVTDLLKGVGGPAVRALVEGLELRQDQLAVVLLTTQECVGTEVFLRLFGLPGDPALVARMAAKARAGGLGPHTDLTTCATFVRALFARFSLPR